MQPEGSFEREDPGERLVEALGGHHAVGDPATHVLEILVQLRVNKNMSHPAAMAAGTLDERGIVAIIPAIALVSVTTSPLKPR